MTFKELAEAIQSMDSIQREQSVTVHLSDGEFEIDLAVKYDGIPVFLIHFGEDEDGSEMASK